MNYYNPNLKASRHERASALRIASVNRLMSRDSKFVYQVLKGGSIIGGGPLKGSRSEAEKALEEMVSTGELSQIYWSGITSVIMLDKDQNKIMTYSLSR
ncbi:MAG: hypothetical protein ABJK39_12090 [Hyphomicrobiales bacterium]